MLVVLPRHAWSRWLGDEQVHEDALLALLKPFPAERMRADPISTRVNAPRIDEPSLLEAVAGR